MAAEQDETQAKDSYRVRLWTGTSRRQCLK